MEVKFKEDDYKFLSLEGLRNYHKTILELISNTKTKILAKNIHIVGENEELKADGGSWASAFKDVGLGTINEKTTLYDVFNKLLRKEQWYDGSVTLYNGSAHITSLSTPSNSTSLDACYEIGTTVNISQTTVSALSGSPQKPYYKFTGFSAGYATDLTTGKKEGPGNPPDITYNTETLSPTYTLTRTKNFGFPDISGTPLTNVGTTTSSLTIPQHLATIALGTNKVTYAYSVSGAKYKYTVKDKSTKTYYPLSSFGNLYKDNSTTPYDTVEQKPQETFLSNGNITATSKTISTTGVYPVFHNAVSETANNIASTDKKIVADSSSFEITYGPEAVADNKFAYPATHSLTKVEVYNKYITDYETYPTECLITDETKTLKSGNVAYKVWTRVGNGKYEDWSKFRFTLNKKTSKQ